MKATLLPLRAKEAGNEGVALLASSSSPSSFACPSDCSTCHKMTRSGMHYGNRCSHSGRCRSRKEHQVQKPASVSSVTPAVRRVTVMFGVSMVVVLLAAVGIALTIHFYGRVSWGLRKSCALEQNCEERKWKLFYPAKKAPQPAAKPFFKFRLRKREEESIPEEHKLVNISQGLALLIIEVFNLAITTLMLLLLP